MKRIRFSLRTLLLLVLCIGSIFVLLPNWGPWVKAPLFAEALNSLTHPVFRPGHRVVAAFTESRCVVLFDAMTGRKLHSIVATYDGYPELKFSPKGNLLLCIGDNEAQVIHADTGKTGLTIPANKANAYFSWSPDETRVAVCFWRGKDCLEIWNVAEGRMERRIDVVVPGRQLDAFTYPVFSSDGNRIISANWNTFCQWDVATGECSLVLNMRHKDPPEVEAKELEAAQSIRELFHGGAFLNINTCVSSDGKRLLTHDRNAKTSKIWNLESGALIRTLPTNKELSDAQLSKDGKMAVLNYITQDSGSTREDIVTESWDTDRGVKLAEIRNVHHQKTVSGFHHVSDDFSRLIVVSDDEGCKLWNLLTGENIAAYKFTMPSVTCPNAKWFVVEHQVAGLTRTEYFVRYDTGQCIHTRTLGVPYLNSGVRDVTDGNFFVEFNGGHAVVWFRTRPEAWWGVVCLWELWMTTFFALAFTASVIGDWRKLKPYAAQ